jgi:hypothetical protein
MKKQELIKIIELVVRKEVKKQVNEIFIKEENSSSLTELVSKPVIERELNEPIRKHYKTKPKKQVNYTSNKTLNKILNETAGGVPQGDGSGYPTMGGGVYDTSKMNDVLLGAGSGNTMVSKEMKREIGAVETMKKAGVSVDQVPDHVTDALTKDYSGLMKAIDQKKNGANYRP